MITPSDDEDKRKNILYVYICCEYCFEIPAESVSWIIRENQLSKKSQCNNYWTVMVETIMVSRSL